MLCALCALCVGCAASGKDPEVARLRQEVAALRRDLEAMKEKSATGPAIISAAPVAPVGEVTLEISTAPSSASVYIDGQLTPERSVTRVASTDVLHIRVEKSGFHAVEQSVVPDRSRSLHYELIRGRGIVHRPRPRSR